MADAPAGRSAIRPNAEPTVYVVDDDPSIRRLLTWLMKREDVRVESFATAEEFLAQPRGDGPACLLLDLTLGGMDGLRLQAQLKESRAELPVIFISATADVPRAVEAVKHGAVDFVVKPFDYKKVVDLARQCLERSAASLARRQREDAVRSGLATLTPREQEVMQHVVAGKPNKVIADELAVSIKTVEVHRARIMEKLNVHSVAELVRVSMLAAEHR
ncbi:MAG TPA: response regulator [Alphaproteobacteria bacterium]